MPNENKKIVDRLFGEKNPELMSLELDKMLEEELAKSEEEMDATLIAELLELLEAETPTASSKRANWQAIRRKLRKTRHQFTIVRRVAAAAAAIVVLFAVSFTTAQAFNWTFLLKYLTPVAQTFGIVTPDYLPEDEQETEYRTEDTEDSQETEFYALDEMPTELGISVVESGCIPKDHRFGKGVWYKDLHMEKYSLIFTHEDIWYNLEILSFANDEDTTINFEYELQASDPQIVNIDGIDVSLYYNSDDSGLYVSWLIGNAHYSVNGTLSEDELAHIIHSLRIYQS